MTIAIILAIRIATLKPLMLAAAKRADTADLLILY
jgi:hypothetical protein